MKQYTFIKHFLIIFSALLLPVLMLFVFLPLHDASAVYDGVIRLHVLAHSDDEEDQKLKLSVRDAILSAFGETINEGTSKEEAEEKMTSLLPEMEALAEKTVKESGYSHDVAVSLCREYYPTREYEGMRLPAGEYLSLRVVIGEGAGQNWWCMVYPPLCTSSAEAGEALSEAGFTPSQVRLLTEDEDKEYVVRFKIVESVSSAWKKVKGWFS
ncbi:MAG: stage II sporulation protein R [Clostridia bacterium]|nr:stage II sporulation protein R [Clostridia bacterium]